jgi:hypothetical protein
MCPDGSLARLFFLVLVIKFLGSTRETDTAHKVLKALEPVVELHESVRGPEFFLKLLASYDLAGVLQQNRQELEGLFLKSNSQVALAQLAGAKI